MIAIGGGGFIPARILRTFLKSSGGRNIPIQAIGLSLYEALPGTTEETAIGKEVIRTQWLDFSTLGAKFGKQGGLLGRRILVVDEVDDSRATLGYALRELKRDVKEGLEKLDISQEEKEKLAKDTKFGIFVVHNKSVAPSNPDLRTMSQQIGLSVLILSTALLMLVTLAMHRLKEKAAELPSDVAYFSGADIPDYWVDYPW